jgi:hypothetical protein
VVDERESVAVWKAANLEIKYFAPATKDNFVSMSMDVCVQAHQKGDVFLVGSLLYCRVQYDTLDKM